MTKCLTFPPPPPDTSSFSEFLSWRLERNPELILKLLYVAGVVQLITGLSSCSAAPSGLRHWAPTQEPGEDGQVENSEMLPTMAGTEKRREEKNVIIIVMFQRQRELWKNRRIRAWHSGNGFSFLLCPPVWCWPKHLFFHCLLQSKANSISPSHMKDWKGEGMGIQSFSECQVITSCDGDAMLWNFVAWELFKKRLDSVSARLHCSSSLGCR